MLLNCCGQCVGCCGIIVNDALNAVELIVVGNVLNVVELLYM